MRKKEKIFHYGHGLAWRLSVFISIILGFIMLLGFLYAKLRDIGNGVKIFDIIGINLLLQFLINAVMLYILFRYQFWAMQAHRNPRKRFFLTVIGSFLLVLFLSPLFAKCQIWLFNENPASPNAHLTFNFVKDLIVLVIVFLLTALTFMWEQRQKTRLENQRLLTENLQNRYDVLKNQVDPHFLFNSLNTLNGLIGYDDDKAHEYVDQLSLVFRHTMHNKEILSLSEELDFTMSYIYLMKIRYNDSLQLITNIDDLYLDYYILPCGLQLLIENAIKHNIVSNKYPLEVTIETSGHDTILVRNNIRRKPEVEAGSGVGLANLNERYRLLFRKEIIIKDMDGIFSVEVPLIKEKEKPKVIQDESYYCRR